jgi:PAS domain S-box-containing protein
MDIILKGDMDGIEAAEQIHDRFDIPVVYVTAYLDEARLEKTKVTEPYGYITKPFEDKELRPVIEMALQRHKREKALRTAEQDWRNSFNSLEDIMLIIDRDYTIENINEIGLKLVGKSKEEVIGQKCYQVIHGAENPAEFCPFKETLETKQVESTDRYEERFGKYYSIKSSPIFDENGEIIKFVDLMRDITERMDINTWHLTNIARGKATKADLIGKNIITHPSIVNAGLSETYKRVLEGEPFDKKGVYFPTLIPGTSGYFDVKGVPVFKDGEVIGAVALHDDITERKQMEEKQRLFSHAVVSRAGLHT